MVERVGGGGLLQLEAADGVRKGGNAQSIARLQAGAHKVGAGGDDVRGGEHRSGGQQRLDALLADGHRAQVAVADDLRERASVDAVNGNLKLLLLEESGGGRSSH